MSFSLEFNGTTCSISFSLPPARVPLEIRMDLLKDLLPSPGDVLLPCAAEELVQYVLSLLPPRDLKGDSFFYCDLMGDLIQSAEEAKRDGKEDDFYKILDDVVHIWRNYGTRWQPLQLTAGCAISEKYFVCQDVLSRLLGEDISMHETADVAKTILGSFDDPVECSPKSYEEYRASKEAFLISLLKVLIGAAEGQMCIDHPCELERIFQTIMFFQEEYALPLWLPLQVAVSGGYANVLQRLIDEFSWPPASPETVGGFETERRFYEAMTAAKNTLFQACMSIPSSADRFMEAFWSRSNPSLATAKSGAMTDKELFSVLSVNPQESAMSWNP